MKLSNDSLSDNFTHAPTKSTKKRPINKTLSNTSFAFDINGSFSNYQSPTRNFRLTKVSNPYIEIILDDSIVSGVDTDTDNEATSISSYAEASQSPSPFQILSNITRNHEKLLSNDIKKFKTLFPREDCRYSSLDQLILLPETCVSFESKLGYLKNEWAFDDDLFVIQDHALDDSAKDNLKSSLFIDTGTETDIPFLQQSPVRTIKEIYVEVDEDNEEEELAYTRLCIKIPDSPSDADCDSDFVDD